MGGRSVQSSWNDGLRGDMESGLVRFALSYPERLKGLLGASPEEEEGVVTVFVPCKSIHTFGMSARLDVAFVDGKGCVVRSIRDVAPRRLLFCKKAAVVLERFAAPGKPWFEAGDSLALVIGAKTERKVRL